MEQFIQNAVMPASILLSLISITLTALLTIASLSLLSTILLELLVSISSLGSALAISTALPSSIATLFTTALLNIVKFISSLVGIFILASNSIVSNTLLLPTTL